MINFSKIQNQTSDLTKIKKALLDGKLEGGGNFSQKACEKLNKLGVQIKLITDGDVSGALLVSEDRYNIDIFLGIGGGPEGVIAAAALDAMNCKFQGKFLFDNEQDKTRAKKMGIKDKVIFFGNSNETSKILSFSDLFLLTSEVESFGLSALEAMAASVPVISTNIGGIPEVNKDGFSGLLSEVGNIDKMTNDSLYILSSEKVLNQFKINAREQAKKFNIQNIVPQYEKIYKKLKK